MLLQLRLTPTLAGYGRDFTCEGKDPLQFACNATARQTVSYFRAKNMLSGSAPVLANVTLTTARRFNTTSQSPSFNYHNKRDGTIHQVAYEDSQSLGSKYALARELGLRGVGFWVASGRWPDQAPASTAGLDAMWGSVRKNFLGKTDDRAAALQKEIDQAVASNAPATIFVSGLYNFSRRSLLIAGAKGLTLQPKKSCVAPTCVPKMIFSVWPCGETEGENAAVCRQINFSDPTVLQCKAASGQRCACADVVWSSGVNISNSHDVTVRGIAIDYSPRGLGTTATCKPGPVPPPPPPDTPTKQFNSGRKFSYLLFNSSRVVTEDLQILSAPFMAITSFLGSGGHVFRRVRFVPDPNDFNAIIALKDGLHESDVRTGLQFIDSTIHGTADDFFNFHNVRQTLDLSRFPLSLMDGITIADSPAGLPLRCIVEQLSYRQSPHRWSTAQHGVRQRARPVDRATRRCVHVLPSHARTAPREQHAAAPRHTDRGRKGRSDGRGHAEGRLSMGSHDGH